jgi:hypothetical protein
MSGTAKKKATPKRKTTECEVVESVPAACPRCKSTERTQLEGGKITRSIKGTSRDGRQFNRVRWSYASCRKCNQRYRIKQLEYT